MKKWTLEFLGSALGEMSRVEINVYQTFGKSFFSKAFLNIDDLKAFWRPYLQK